MRKGVYSATDLTHTRDDLSSKPSPDRLPSFDKLRPVRQQRDLSQVQPRYKLDPRPPNEAPDLVLVHVDLTTRVRHERHLVQHGSVAAVLEFCPDTLVRQPRGRVRGRVWRSRGGGVG